MPSWGPATSSPLPAALAPAAFAPLAPAPLASAPAAGTWLDTAGPLSFGGLWAQAPRASTVTSNNRLNIFRIVLSIKLGKLVTHRPLGTRKRRPHRFAHVAGVGAQA